jgi:hypothetical protein
MVLSAHKILCAAIPEPDRETVFNETYSISQDHMKSYSEMSHILEMKSERLNTLIENNENLCKSKQDGWQFRETLLLFPGLTFSGSDH